MTKSWETALQEILKRMSYNRRFGGKLDNRNEEYFKLLKSFATVDENIKLPEYFAEFENNSFNAETGKYEIEGIA